MQQVAMIDTVVRCMASSRPMFRARIRDALKSLPLIDHREFEKAATTMNSHLLDAAVTVSNFRRSWILCRGYAPPSTNSTCLSSTSVTARRAASVLDVQRSGAAAPQRPRNLMPEQHIWYVAYGSNMCRERFLRYLDGDVPVGDVVLKVPYPVYFAGLRKSRIGVNVGLSPIGDRHARAREDHHGRP